MNLKNKIPLFPLPMVVLPGQVVPLHIFEQRYHDLLKQCLDGSEFGVNFASELGLAVMGCSLKIRNIVGKHADGSIDLIAEGQRRYKLDKVLKDKSFDEGEVEFIEEAENLGLPKERVERFLDLHSKVAALAGVKSKLIFGEGPLSYKSACDLGLEDLQKQTLLELSAEEDRVVWLSDLYSAIILEKSGQADKASKDEYDDYKDPGLGNVH